MSLSRNISNTRDSVSSGYPNTRKRVENNYDAQRSIFDEICVWIANETLYLLNRNKTLGVNGQIKSLKSMLI